MKSFAILLFFTSVWAFPWVADAPGVHSPWSKAHQRAHHKRQQPGEGPGGAASCPFNANHEPAAPATDDYPYNNAKNGLPGDAKGGYQVPDPVSSARTLL